MAGLEFDCIIQINPMDQNTIKSILARANLALPLSTFPLVLGFLQQHIGTTSENMNFEVFAALAIVSQVDKVKSVRSMDLADSGITIEKVLRHSGGLSKESLLQVVTRQCNKWREAPVWLGTKIENVKMSYRMFKKYRSVFDSLCSVSPKIDKQAQSDLMAIFWIVFLFTKNRTKDEVTAIDSTNILYCLFIMAFGQILTQLNLNEEIISQHFRRHFSEYNQPTEHQYIFYRDRMKQELQQVHDWRAKGQFQLDLKQLTTNQNFMQRFLDDLDNNYNRFKVTLPKHTVDQINFIELDKTLTPQSIIRSHGTPQRPIQKKIDFQNLQDDFMDEEPPMDPQPPSDDRSISNPAYNPNPTASGRTSRMEPMSPFISHSSQGTPWSSRYKNLQWVNKNTSKTEEKDYQEIRVIYEEGTGNSYSEYYQVAMDKIMQSISKFTPTCMDFNKRQKSIYSFFICFIKRINEKHENKDGKQIFEKDSHFDSILCLVTNLFNYAYQSLQSLYRQYCTIFGISLIDGLIPFNWVGLNIQMPKGIEGYLYDLQKKILIQQIWDGQQGFQLIQNPKLYRDQALIKRLRLHTDERAQQLCESMRIEDKQITKIVNLVRFIIDQRKGLLRQNKIDQIIVCSIGSILSINHSRTFSLEEIFNHYNKMLYSLNISRSIFYDNEGKETDLVHYYNYVFLEQVQEIISNQEQAQKVLDTPIRLERKQSIDKGIEMTPLNIKFKQVAIGAYGCKRLKKEQGADKNPTQFRNTLVHSLKNLNIKQEQQNDQQELASPRFGSMHRTISFGDINQKF